MKTSRKSGKSGLQEQKRTDSPLGRRAQQEVLHTKVEIQSTLADIETHLDQDQFKEISDSLTEKFKSAAPISLEKKLKTGPQKQGPRSRQDKRNNNQRRPPNRNQDRQLKMLSNGLNKLIQSRK